MSLDRSRYNSLEDYLSAEQLTVNAVLDDGGGERFPVKGRELDAVVLFADISGFSGRTADLDPTETLAFINHFFAWTMTEGLKGYPGIVDKYIGDEVMIVFSKDFGSDDPFEDAVRVGCGMAKNDAWSFMPHVGIAAGRVIIGYVGTPAKYSASVFGAPVALASRCAGQEPPEDAGSISSWVTFPSDDWGDRELNDVIPPRKGHDPRDGEFTYPQTWDITASHSATFKNMGDRQVRNLVNRSHHFPSQSAEDRARESVAKISEAGFRWQRRDLSSQ